MINGLNILLIFILLLVPSNAMAINGEFYAGRLDNIGGSSKYISGFKIGQQINRFRPHLGIRMIENDSFQLRSIVYTVGLNVNVWKDVYLNFKHLYWDQVEGEAMQHDRILLKWKFKIN